MTVVPFKKNNKVKSKLECKASGSNAEIMMFGPIMSDLEVEYWGTGISAKVFDRALKDIGRVSNIQLRINSEGGSVTEARAIQTMLAKNPAKINVEIEGLAASAATLVAMAGDTISIGKHDFFMIHNSRAVSFESMTADQYYQLADTLKKVDGTISDMYMARTGKSESQIKKWLDAETWFTGAEALEHGFVDTVIESDKQAVASVTGFTEFKNMPAAFNNRPGIAFAKSLLK